MSSLSPPLATLVRALHRIGHTPVAVGLDKKPIGKGWQSTTDQSGDDAVARCATASAIGLLLDNDIIDIDLDSVWAVKLARDVLPTGGAWFDGGQPDSAHVLYRISRPAPKYRKFKLADGTVLLELRAGKHQTILPPSPYADGRVRTWRDPNDWSPLVVSDPVGPIVALQPINSVVIVQAVERLAVLARLLRFYPGDGSRNEYIMAASGLLAAGATR